MGSKTKHKPSVSFGLGTAHLSSSAVTSSPFGTLSLAGLKTRSTPGSLKSVPAIHPDLDLVGGFAFLSFASLAELETHIEHNEGTSGSIRINIGVKGKITSNMTLSMQNTAPCSSPEKKRKTATVSRKKPSTKKLHSVTSDGSGLNQENSRLLGQQANQASSFFTDFPKNSKAVGVDGTGEGNSISSSMVDSEISLLCSETVDLGDEDDSKEEGRVGCNTGKVAVSECAQTELSPSGIVDRLCQVEVSAVAEQTNTKKKKKKKRRNEHCDQTSQTKFRIKKKKASCQLENSDGLSPTMVGEFNDIEPYTSLSPGEKTSPHDKIQMKGPLYKSRIEKINWCARTAGIQCLTKYQSWKNKILDQSTELSCKRLKELKQSKNLNDEMSPDSFPPNGEDQDGDIGEDAASVSLYSELSDHSSDGEPVYFQGCFLLNNKIEKVEQEEAERDVIIDVDSSESEVRKNFLVVSGLKTGPMGHFSFHPDVTKEGTIDTSIQAYANEIDIFTKCAMMQEGEVIKVISPDDSHGFQSLFMQKLNRDPDSVKASRSATERKRRHHIGDLFNDLKLEVFTDLVDADLYFSKQTILSKGIGTIEELEKEIKEKCLMKEQLIKENKELKTKRNLLLFGDPLTTIDEGKVEAILKHFNIEVDYGKDQDENEKEENEDANYQQDTHVDTSSQPIAQVTAAIKGRPRAKNTLLAPCQTVHGSKYITKDDNAVKTNLQRNSKQCSSGLPSVMTTKSESSQTPEESPLPFMCVPFGNQAQKSKDNSAGPLKAVNSKVPDKKVVKYPHSDAAEQVETKLSLIKIAPKPAIVHLNPLQQPVSFQGSLGQVKPPSSDKIICNLSRLSTQQSTSKSSNICIVRSGHVMKSMESKNVMHMKITSDALEKTGSTSGNIQGSVATISQPIPGPAKVHVSIAASSTQNTSQLIPQASHRSLNKPASTSYMTSGRFPSGILPLSTVTYPSTTKGSDIFSKSNQTSSDAVLKALTSLNNVQARPRTGKVDCLENPVESILKGLKNVVMKAIGPPEVPTYPSAVATGIPSTSPTVAVLPGNPLSISVPLSIPLSTTASSGCLDTTDTVTTTCNVSSTAATSVPSSISISEQQTTPTLNFMSGKLSLPSATEVDSQIYEPFIEASALVLNERTGQSQEPSSSATVLTKEMLPMQVTSPSSVFSSTLLGLLETSSPKVLGDWNTAQKGLSTMDGSVPVTLNLAPDNPISLQVDGPSLCCSESVLTSSQEVEGDDIPNESQEESGDDPMKALDHTYSKTFNMVGDFSKEANTSQLPLQQPFPPPRN